MENLEIYNKYKSAPPEALKQILGGRMKGMTDINPMWRIKCLTEQFGACGFGWYYKTTNKWLEHGQEGQISAFVDIDLFVKVDGEWSMPISGTGGSSFVAQETSGLKMSDECFKMATTDAISVACKQLGFGADVYWSKDKTKYDNQEQEEVESIRKQKISELKVKAIKTAIANAKVDPKSVLDTYRIKSFEEMTEEMFLDANKKLGKM